MDYQVFDEHTVDLSSVSSVSAQNDSREISGQKTSK